MPRPPHHARAAGQGMVHPRPHGPREGLHSRWRQRLGRPTGAQMLGLERVKLDSSGRME
jgi:hypothetical protein